MIRGIRPLLLATLGFFLFYNCEKDDVCVGLLTPRLPVQFYKAQYKGKEEKEGAKLRLDRVTVVALDGKAPDTLYREVSVDALYLPLRIDRDSSRFKIEVDEKSSDLLRIRYTRKNEFVSKACGLRSIYLNLREIHTNDSLKSVVINRQDTLKNEAEKGLSIYF